MVTKIIGAWRRLVSQAEAEAGTSQVAFFWSPERVKQAIEALAPKGTGGTGTNPDVTVLATVNAGGRVRGVVQHNPASPATSGKATPGDIGLLTSGSDLADYATALDEVNDTITLEPGTYIATILLATYTGPTNQVQAGANARFNTYHDAVMDISGTETVISHQLTESYVRPIGGAATDQDVNFGGFVSSIILRVPAAGAVKFRKALTGQNDVGYLGTRAIALYPINGVEGPQGVKGDKGDPGTGVPVVRSGDVGRVLSVGSDQSVFWDLPEDVVDRADGSTVLQALHEGLARVVADVDSISTHEIGSAFADATSSDIEASAGWEQLSDGSGEFESLHPAYAFPATSDVGGVDFSGSGMSIFPVLALYHGYDVTAYRIIHKRGGADIATYPGNNQYFKVVDRGDLGIVRYVLASEISDAPITVNAREGDIFQVQKVTQTSKLVVGVVDLAAAVLSRLLPSPTVGNQGKFAAISPDGLAWEVVDAPGVSELLRGRVDALDHLTIDLEQDASLPAYSNADAAQAQVALVAATSANDEFVLRTVQAAANLAWSTQVVAPGIGIAQFGSLLLLRINDAQDPDHFSVLDGATNQRVAAGQFTKIGEAGGWIYYQWNNHPHAFVNATFTAQKADSTTHVGTTLFKGDVTEAAVKSAVPDIDHNRSLINSAGRKLVAVSFTDAADTPAVSGDDIRMGYLTSSDPTFGGGAVENSDFDAYKFAIQSPMRTVSEHIHVILYLAYNPAAIDLNEWAVKFGNIELDGHGFNHDVTSLITSNLPVGWRVLRYSSGSSAATIFTIPRDVAITLAKHNLIPTWNSRVKVTPPIIVEVNPAAAARIAATVAEVTTTIDLIGDPTVHERVTAFDAAGNTFTLAGGQYLIHFPIALYSTASGSTLQTSNARIEIVPILEGTGIITSPFGNSYARGGGAGTTNFGARNRDAMLYVPEAGATITPRFLVHGQANGIGFIQPGNLTIFVLG